MTSSLINIIGIIGTVMVTYSNIPQLLLFFRQRHAKGISLSSTWIYTIGIILRAAFMMFLIGLNLIVMIPYVFSILSGVLTLYFCYIDKE